MAIMTERDLERFDAFGANEDYCNKKYPVGENPQVNDWNARCKKSCSGLACVSKPGLLAAPWTIVGKSARGLPDDSLLGQVLRPGLQAIGAGGAGGGAGAGGPPPTDAGAKEAGILGGIDTNILLIGGLGLAAFFMFGRKGGRGRGRSFSGYSRQHRRIRRTRRGSKRRS